MTDEPLRRAGDNNPPEPMTLKTGIDLLDQLHETNPELRTRIEELMAAAGRADALLPIDSDEKAGKVATFLKLVKACAGFGDERRLAASLPYRDATDAVNGWFARTLKPLLDKRDQFARLNETFLNEKDARLRREAAERARAQREEAAARAREAQQAREAEAAAARAAQTAADEAAREVAKADAEEAQRRAEMAAAAAAQAQSEATAAEAVVTAKPSELGAVSGEFASTGLKTTWDFEVVDLSKVPLAYLTVNESAVKQAIKGKHGQRAIPGLRIFPKRSAVVR